jgi:hypothetical protein
MVTATAATVVPPLGTSMDVSSLDFENAQVPERVDHMMGKSSHYSTLRAVVLTKL